MARQSFIFFSAMPYDHCLSGRTRRLADTLAGMGHKVVFVERPSSRATLRRWTGTSQNSEPGSGVRVIALAALPGHERMADGALVRAWTAWLRRRLCACLTDAARSIAIVSTPWWTPIVRALPHRQLYYDYLDHLSVHAAGRPDTLLRRRDRELLDLCDAVTTVSAQLQRTLAEETPGKPVHLVPNAVERR